MSYKHHIKRILTVHINGKEDQIEELSEALDQAFKSGCCSWDGVDRGSRPGYDFKITGSETGTMTVYPGCYTMPNGDPGYPDDFKDDIAICEETVEDFIDDFAASRDYEFDYLVTSTDEETD